MLITVLCFKSLDEVENGVNDHPITDAGVDHAVVDVVVRPFHAKILLDEILALAINSIHELFGFAFTLTASQKATNFIFSRGVKKDA
jgi:hypothetical protein